MWGIATLSTYYQSCETAWKWDGNTFQRSSTNGNSKLGGRPDQTNAAEIDIVLQENLIELKIFKHGLQN